MRAVPLLAAALCACTYEAEKPQIFVQVDRIPQIANRLDVELTFGSGTSPIGYSPSFGPGTVRSLQLALAAPPQAESFHIQVDAFESKGTRVATGSADGSLPAAATLQITLASVAGQVGGYGSPCDSTPGNTLCLASQCEQYVPTDPASGICTIACRSDSDCPGTVPAATCVAFPGGTLKACQWDCTSGGSCPANLFCHPVPGTGGRSFCEGD